MWSAFRKRLSSPTTHHPSTTHDQNTYIDNDHGEISHASYRRNKRVSWIDKLTENKDRELDKSAIGCPLPPQRASRRRRCFRKPPVIAERQSSLYRIGDLEKDESYITPPSSPQLLDYEYLPSLLATEHVGQTSLYSLPQQAQSVFDLPSPSGKKGFTLLDLQSHEDLWEEVFDSAARCSFYRQSTPQAAHWKPWSTSLDLPSTALPPARRPFSMASVVMEGAEPIQWRDSFIDTSRSASPAPSPSASAAPSRPARSALRDVSFPASSTISPSPAPVASSSTLGARSYEPRPSVVEAFNRFNEIDITSPVFSQDTPVLGHQPSPVLEDEDDEADSASDRNQAAGRTMYQLAVDKPLPEDTTPPLSTSSSDDGQSGLPTPKPITPLVPADLPSFPWRKRHSNPSMSRDPYKIKDGLESKNSTSGVYTPTTYPGPAPALALAPPISLSINSALSPPSRSASLSSGYSEASSSLQTPNTAGLNPYGAGYGYGSGYASRASFSSMARSVGRRVSQFSLSDRRESVATSTSAYSTHSNSGHSDGGVPHPPYSASSIRSFASEQAAAPSRPGWGSYFPWVGTSQTQTVASPSAATSTANANHGLGFGPLSPAGDGPKLSVVPQSPDERVAAALDEFGSPSLSTVEGSPRQSNASGSLGNAAKGKRKPVPRLLEVDTDSQGFEDEEGGEEMIDMRPRLGYGIAI